MKFAKMYENTELGQIIVFLGLDLTGEPCLNTAWSTPESLEVRYARTTYPPGTERVDAAAGILKMFEEMDEEKARLLVSAYQEEQAGPFRVGQDGLPEKEFDDLQWIPFAVDQDPEWLTGRVDLRHADGTEILGFDVDNGTIDWCAHGGVTHWRPWLASADTAEVSSPSALATHRCTICHALWRFCPQAETGFDTDTWSLKSPRCGSCCDNVEMGDQIVPLDPFISEGGDQD